MRIRSRFLVTLLLAAACAGCGIYSFSGSSLPAYLKTVDIPLFVNQSLQPEAAEEITRRLTAEVLRSNLLKIVSGSGDATLRGLVRSYEHQERFIDIRQARDASVTEYEVRIVVAVEFIDNRKSEPIYQGTVTGLGTYDPSTGKEEDARSRAVADIVEQVMQNSVQGW